MPECRTRALVLRTFDQGESDRIVHLYTEEIGRVSAIAKGARRSRRRFPGTLEILTVVHAQLDHRPARPLARLDGAALVRSFEPLVADLGRYAVACSLIEILERFTGERESSPDLFRFALGVLEVLGAEPPDRLFALLVQVKTLARLGYRPELAACTECGRPTRRGGRVGFAPRHGGAVCGECAGPDDPRVPAAWLTGLDLGIGLPLRERSGTRLRPNAVARLETLLDRFFQFHLGATLRSSALARRVLPFEPVVASSLDAPPGHGDTAPAPRGRRPGPAERGPELPTSVEGAS